MQATDERRMLILDFDGVVVDTEPLNYEAWGQAFDERLGLRRDGTHHDLVGLTLDEIYQLWAGDDLPDAETRTALLAYKNDLFYALVEGGLLGPLPGCVELIRCAQAAGWYVGVVSRSLRKRLIRTLDLIGMPALFDVVLGYEDGIIPETNRKDHAIAARMFGIDPAACIVIEDSATGVRDARAAGIGTVVGLTTSLEAEVLRQAGAHVVVNQLSEVEGLVKSSQEKRT